MLIPQYPVLVLKLSPIHTVSLNTVFSILQNQCYPGTSCILFSQAEEKGDKTYLLQSAFERARSQTLKSVLQKCHFKCIWEIPTEPCNGRPLDPIRSQNLKICISKSAIYVVEKSLGNYDRFCPLLLIFLSIDNAHHICMICQTKYVYVKETPSELLSI